MIVWVLPWIIALAAPPVQEPASGGSDPAASDDVAGPASEPAPASVVEGQTIDPDDVLLVGDLREDVWPVVVESTGFDPAGSDPTGAHPAAAAPIAEGPPYYTADQIRELRERYELPVDPHDEPGRPRWGCLVADPRCGFTVEIQAMGAYGYRIRQGDVSLDNDLLRWRSGRAAYDVWVDLPAYVETRGQWKYTRLTLGPKGGIIASDGQDLWGNVGMAGRYWFGRGAWAPALEFTTAFTFRLRSQRGSAAPGPARSPIGITADIGLSVGGWGAIVFGAQYDSPLAREEIPERFRQAAAGQIFVGFRGNILWGAPAIAAVATQAATQRSVVAP